MELLHPGAVLREEYLEPMQLTAYRLAKSINVPVNRITAIVNEERSITPETSLLLARYFEVSDFLWADLQLAFDIECAKDAMCAQLQLIRPYNYTPDKHRNDLWLPQ